MREDTTYLYRTYDKAGRLLYIGISADPDYRIYQHQSISSPTWEMGLQIDRWTCWRYPTRGEAEDAEAEAIWDEDPPYNKWGRPYLVDGQALSFAERLRQEARAS